MVRSWPLAGLKPNNSAADIQLQQAFVEHEDSLVSERGARLMLTGLPLVLLLAVMSGGGEGMGTLLLWPPTG